MTERGQRVGEALRELFKREPATLHGILEDIGKKPENMSGLCGIIANVTDVIAEAVG